MNIAPQSSMTSDRQLRTAIIDALDDDPCVPGPRIGVSVTDHVVTLTGTVLSDRERAAAIVAARGVTGVLTVVDDILIADSRHLDSTEQDIALAVEHELSQVVDETPVVQGIVRGRVVTLTGTADDHRQKYALVFAIRDIPGVCWVEDQVVDREQALHNAARRADPILCD